MQNIGFTQYESQVYLALLQQSHISGYELAKVSGVPASKIYQILNKLTDKEMERLVTWMDTNALFYGTFNKGDQLRQRRGERISGPDLE